jgi:large repetitive protein
MSVFDCLLAVVLPALAMLLVSTKRGLVAFLRVLFAAFLALLASYTAVFATPFTTQVPGTGITIPSTYPQAGGVVIVLEGTNGNVYYQYVNPSTMFQGYQNNGTPTAWQGNPFQITPPMVLNCGPVVSCSTYLGGGITRMSVRFTAYDGDNQAGMFDFNDLNLRINGSNFGANNGNWSTVQTQNTDPAGTTLISSGTGFGNNTTDTGWFQSTDPAILGNVLSTGVVTASIFDRDPNDNFWDFKRGNDADTSAVPLNVAPGVTLDKSSTTTSYSTVGQVIPYTFTYRNVGSVWIRNVAISDPRITGVTCPAPPTAITINLDPAEQVVCTGNYTVTQADIDAGRILNTATATGTPQAGSLGPVTDNHTIPGPLSAPVVQLTKTASPTPFGPAGSTLTYSFAVRNNGNVTLSNVSIADPALAGLSCTTPSIPPNTTVTATCTGNTRTITQANVDNGSIPNTATVTAGAPNGTSVTAPSSIITTGPARTGGITLVKLASAIVDLDANGQDEGDRINYNFLVTNTGTVTLTGVGVTDAKVGVVSCPTTTLIPSASTTCTATYFLTQADVNAGNVTNTANVTSTPPAGVTGPITDVSGTTPTNNTPTVTPITRSPSMSIDKTNLTANFDSVGDVVNYSYVVRNTGNVTITSPITVSDNRTAVACPALPVGGLLPNNTITCTASYTVTQNDIDAGGVTNLARSQTTVNGVTVNSPNDQVTVPSVQNRSMSVAKIPTSVNFLLGGTVSYQYVVTNAGNTTLTAPITISDNRITTVNCPALPPGGLRPLATLTCTASYTTTQDDVDLGSVTNLATASSGPTSSPQVSATIPSGAQPALTVSKVSLTASYNNVGDVVTYRYTIRNTGNVPLSSARPITISDDKIAGPISCPNQPANLNPEPNPSSSFTCDATYTVTQADIDRGSVTNQAFASTTFGVANIPVTSPPANATVNAVQNPSLLVTKSVATPPVTVVGQVLTYTIRTENNGDTTISSINVSDPLIPTLSCSIASLAPGAFSNCVGTYTVTQDDFNTGEIINNATANGVTPQGTPVSGSDTNDLDITQSSSVSISKFFVSNADEDASSSVTLNDTLTYRVIVTNDGNITQNNVVVSDPLLTPNSTTCAAVLPRSRCILTGSLTVNQARVDAGMINNTASVTTTLLPTPETASAPPVNVPRTPRLTVDKRAPTLTTDVAPAGVVSLGDTLTYPIVVTNTGNVTMNTILVTDTRPSAVVNCPAPSAGTPAFDPGEAVTCTATYVVQQSDVDAGRIVNTANATATPPAGLTVPTATDTNTLNGIPANPRVELTKTASPTPFGAVGSTVTYSFSVRNTGNVTLSSITISDPALASLSCTVPNIGPGNTETATCSGNVRTVTQENVDQGFITNTATVSAQTPGGATISDDSSITTAGPTRTGAVTLVKNASAIVDIDGNGEDVGDRINYSFVVNNTGNVTLTSIAINDPDVTGLSCPVATLAPGASTTCTAFYLLTQTDIDNGSHSNSATVQATPPGGPANSVTDTSGTAPSNDTPTVSPITRTPTLTIDKTSPQVSFDSTTDVLSYTYVVRNTGNVTIATFSVADNKTTVNCPSSGPIAPGGSVTCTATYTAQQADLNAGEVINVATTSATSPAGAVPVATDQVRIPAVQNPRMTLTKNARAPVPTTLSTTPPNNTITYDFVIANTGNITLNGPFTINDNRIGAISCAGGPIAPGGNLLCSATYTVVFDDVSLGTITNLASATDGTTTSPQTSETVPESSNPAISITKTPNATQIESVGQVIQYSYVVTNSGNATLTRQIDIIDDKFGAPIPCWVPAQAEQFLPTQTRTCTANYTVTQSDLDRGIITNQAYGSTTFGGGNIPVVSPPITANVDASQDPQLTVTKSVSPSTGLLVGQVLTYTIRTTNTGDVTVSGVTVSDPLIPSLSCPAVNISPTLPSNFAECVGTYTVTQADFDAGVINNTATASGLTPQGNPVSDTGTLSTTGFTAAAPALTLGKTASPAIFDAVGETITYTFTVSNTGNATLTNVRVTDPLLPTFSCVIPSLAPGAVDTSCSTTYRVTQADIDAGQLVNTATVTSDPPRGVATPPTAQGTSTIPGPTREPAANLVKTVLPATYDSVGDVLTYSFLVTNTGNISLINTVTINDPALSATPIACPALPVGGLAPGESITCTRPYSVIATDLANGQIVNTAVANTFTRDPADVGNPNPVPLASNTDSVTSDALIPGIALIKTAGPLSDPDGNGADPGDTIVYSFLVSNSGELSVSAIAISDPKVGAVSCPTTTLAPLASTICTATYTLRQADVDAGQVENSATVNARASNGATVSDQSDPTTPGPSNNDPTVTPLPQAPGLTIVKTADLSGLSSPLPRPGDRVTYRFAVRNAGNITLTDVAVTDALPGIVINNSPIASIAPGATSNAVTATYVLTSDDISAGFVQNSAVATGNYTDAAGNPQTTSDTSGTATGNNTPTRFALVAAPGVAIIKSAVFNDISAPAGASTGDTINYSFAVTNTGNVRLTNLRVNDPLLLGGVTCPVTTLEPGASTTCTASAYAITQDNLNAGEVTNQATANSDAVVDGETVGVFDRSGSTNDNDNVTVTPLAVLSANFTKVANKTVVRVGETVTFTIRAGDVAFAPVDFVDILPGGLTFIPGSATLNGAAVEPVVSVRRVSFNNVTPVAGSVTITLRAIVNASAGTGSLINRAQLLQQNGALVAEARATIEIRPEPVFDCSDIIGKVFDDANRNGIQDAETSPYTPERGLPGVRLATVNGELITTDKNGLFHVPCAAIPDFKIGSNFILKVDPRSLPSGYRLTTENPRVVRLTRGKLTKINFGASISRLVKLDLTDKVFVSGGASPKLKAAIQRMVAILDEDQSVVRLQYHVGGDGKAIAARRVKLVSDYIASSWKKKGSRYKLQIETRLLLGKEEAAEQ